MLAKLAIAGDERALDLLSWNPQSKTWNVFGQMKGTGTGLDGCAFFIGTDDGSSLFSLLLLLFSFYIWPYITISPFSIQY